METATAAHTHTPHASYTGTASCARCLSSLSNVYAARNIETGAIETFGSDCHYQVTGVDTRQSKAEQDRSARVTRNRASMPAEDVALLDEVRAAIAHLTAEDIDRRNTCVWFDIRDWDARWNKGNMDLGAWISMVVANMRREGDTDGLAQALADGVTLVDLNKVTGKAMNSRFASKCGTCDGPISKGESILYNGQAHHAHHGA